MRRLITVASTVLALCAATSMASAQQLGAPDPRLISPASLGGDFSGILEAGLGLPHDKAKYGIRAGEFIIQPRFFLEGAYTTNFFRVDTRNDSTEERDAFTLHLRPGFAIFNPDPDNVEVKLGVDANVFLPLSPDEQIQAQRDVGLEADAAVSLFPEGVLTLTLADKFERELWMRPAVGTESGNRNRNRLGGDLAFHPGGKALELRAGYRWDILRYDDIGELNSDAHEFEFITSWRFYPLSHLFLQANLRLHEWSRDLSPAEEQAEGHYVPGKPVRAYLGVSGYLTERFVLMGKVGYGNSLLAQDRDAEDFSSVIAQLQASFRFTPKTAWHIGGERNFDLVAFGGHYAFWRAYTSLAQNLADILLLNLDFSLDFRRFGAWQPPAVTTSQGTAIPVPSDRNRTDPVLRGGVLVDFNISRLFGASLGYRYSASLTDFTLTTEGRETHQGFDEHRVFATLNLRY